MRRLSWEDADESALVLAAQAGDLAAFDHLARLYRPAGILVANQVLRCRDGAEDVVQDALLSAYKALPKLQDVTRFAAWFGTIVRHRALRFLSSPARLEEPLSAHVDRLILREAPSISANPPSLNVEAAELLAELPEDLSEIARLYYLHEWPVAQIGALLALPNTTVKWRLHEVRKRLRKNLERLLET